MNTLVKLLCVSMVVMASIIILFRGGNTFKEISSIYLWFRYILLLGYIIPISLVVNMEFAKMFYCVKINTDLEIPGTNVNNKTIPEELGRIQFLLSDKTGTLT